MRAIVDPAFRPFPQQARFDDFIMRYNTDRPHQALGMKVPADLYGRSPRVYRGLEELTYPFHDQTLHERLPPVSMAPWDRIMSDPFRLEAPARSTLHELSPLPRYLR